MAVSVEYQTPRNLKPKIHYSTHDTGRTKHANLNIPEKWRIFNLFMNILSSDHSFSPAEMLWCRQLWGLQRVKEMDWGKQDSPWGMLCLRRRCNQISAQI
jgi:hypothetical protein